MLLFGERSPLVALIEIIFSVLAARPKILAQAENKILDFWNRYGTDVLHVNQLETVRVLISLQYPSTTIPQYVLPYHCGFTLKKKRIGFPVFAVTLTP